MAASPNPGNNYRNFGVSTINQSLVSDLKQKTTYPPAEIATHFTSLTILARNPQLRDTDQLDCGYHYDCLDYVWTGRNLSSSLLLTNGVAIGIYGPDVAQRRQEIFDRTVGIMRSLVKETRAEIIIPLGGAIIPYVVDPKDLAQASGVQVLNTKAIGIRFAEMCVRFNMAQSELTYPRAKLSYEDFRT